MADQLWWIIGLYVAVGAGALIVTTVPRFRGRETRRLVRSLGLPLGAEQEEPVRRRVVARRRGATIGALLGLALAAILVASETGPPPGSLTPLVLVGGVFAGLAVGVAVVASLHSIRVSDDQPRFARAEAVTINDYVSWIERWGARGPVALATAFLTFSLVLATINAADYARSPLLLPGGFVTLAAIAALIFFELAGRRIVRRSQPSGSPAELAWDDALRSITIRDLASAPFLLGLVGTMLVIMDLSTALVTLSHSEEWVRTASLIAINVLANALFYVLVLALLFGLASQPQRHFLRRLWPELATATQPPAADVAQPHPTDTVS